MANAKTTARLTGAAYLVLAIAGVVGFLVVRAEIFVAGDAAATYTNYIENPSLVRLGLVAMLTVALAQAVTALGFYKLFKDVSPTSAFAIAAFGIVNSVIILVGTAFGAAAHYYAVGGGVAPGGDQAATVQMLATLDGFAWSVGDLFFGLWLIPMGFAVAKSGYFHRGTILKWILVAGGVGYILTAFVSYGFADAPELLVENLTIFADVGELWIILALIVVGVREGAEEQEAAQRGATA